MVKLIVSVVALVASSLAYSNVEKLHKIECTECSSWFSKPVTTFAEFAPSHPSSIVVFVGGGGTNVGWASGKRDLFVPKYPSTAAVYNLTKRSTAMFMLDFPGNLGNMYHGGGFSAAGRGSTNHHRQITQVIKFARNKYPNKPVYLIGHSNGTVSLNRTIRFLADSNQLSLVNGLVLSAPIPQEIGNYNSYNIRALVSLHENDMCKDRLPYRDLDRVVNDLLEETSNVKGVLVAGGTNRGAGRNGCKGGFHSYENAEDKFTDILHNWIKE